MIRLFSIAAICASLLIVFSGCSGKTNDNKVRLYFDEANHYYRDHQYADALRIYEDLIQQGSQSAVLHFNAGNAAFRLYQEKQKNGNPVGLLARSLRHFERARLLDPWDGEIRRNLDFARGVRADRLEPERKNPLLFFYRMPAEAHTLIALIFFLVAGGGFGFYFILKNPEFRLVARNLGFAALVSYGLFLGMSRLKYHEEFESPIFFLQSEAVELKAEPSSESKTLFSLHEGARLLEKRKVGEWSLVRLENGSEGWLEGHHLLHL